MSFNVDSERIAGRLGYSPPAPSRIVEKIDKLVKEAQALVEFAGAYSIREVQVVTGPHVFLEGDVYLMSGTLANLLSRCNKVAIYVATIGGDLEDLVGEFCREGAIFKGEVLDMIGSEAVAQSVVSLLEKLDRQLSLKRLRMVGRPFSPGYCDWNILQQVQLFQALKGLTSVLLTNNCLMVPQKSISGIVGIGDVNAELYNQCSECDRGSCKDRRTM